MIGWRKSKSLTDQLVSAKIKCDLSSDNKSAPCCRSRCQSVPFIEETKLFKTKGILNSSSNLVVYLTECKSCSKQYMRYTITMFCIRFNNCKSGTKKSLTNSSQQM